MTNPAATRVHLGAPRVRGLRIAAAATFLVMTIAAVALFFLTLELSLRLPPSNPYSDIYLLVASAGPLAVLLQGLGVLVIWRHTDHDTVEPVGRSRILGGGLACTLLAAASAALTALVTPAPLGHYAVIAVVSLLLTAVVTTASLIAFRAGPMGRPGAKIDPHT